MDLLKLFLVSNKSLQPCFLCLRSDQDNFDIRTVFEIGIKCGYISLSLAEMLKQLFPDEDFVFKQTCNNCSDLISELYILLYKRKSKLSLLDCMVKQLIIKTDTLDSASLDSNKLVLKIELPTYQEQKNVCKTDKHNDEQNKTTDNDEADTICPTNNKLIEKTVDHQVENTEEVKLCQYCPEIFQGMEELKSHLKAHRKKRQRRHIYHFCDDCNYKTLSMTTLQGHINKQHLQTRPHTCQICCKGFFNRSNLKEHIKTHSNSRNQICERCGDSFIHKKNLIEHLRLHSDTRPYECHICHKNFVTSGRRSDHIKRSHMEKTECCIICNKKYSMKKELTRHMNNVHLRSV